MEAGKPPVSSAGFAVSLDLANCVPIQLGKIEKAKRRAAKSRRLGPKPGEFLQEPMSFTVSDFNDLKRLLLEHPEWRAELRQLLFAEDLEAIAESLRAVNESHRRSEQRLARVEESLQELAEAQRQSEQRLERVETAVESLAEAQRQTEQRLDALAEAQRKTEQRLERVETAVEELAVAQRQTEQHLRELAERVKWLTDKVAWLDGAVLELHYERRVGGYFAWWLRRAKAVPRDDLWDPLETHLSHEETRDALMADLIVRGRVIDHPDCPEVYLIVEISSIVEDHDVERAIRRAELFRRAGFPAIPAVAGRDSTPGANAWAESHGVAMLRDGRQFFWDTALERWPVA